MIEVLIAIVVVAFFLGVIIWWLDKYVTFIDPPMKQVIKAALILAFILFVFWEAWAHIHGLHP